MLPPFLTGLFLPNLQSCKFGAACRWFESNSKKRKERSTQGSMPFWLDFKVAQPATKQSTGLFLPNLSSPNLEQLVVGLSPIQKNEKNGAHKAVYHFGWTSRLRNLLRNCPLDCFSQICPAPNLEQLVVGSSNY